MARFVYEVLADQRKVREVEELDQERDVAWKAAGTFRIGRLNAFPSDRIDSVDALVALVAQSMLDPDSYFEPPASDPQPIWAERAVTFTSTGGEFGSTERVTAEFACEPRSKRAAIIIPHWNAISGVYLQLSKVMALCGVAACVFTLPYHAERGAGGRISNEFLNADISSALNSVRQSVIEIRILVRLLRMRGFRSVTLVGVSLGSCVAALVTAFEKEVDAAVLLLTAGDFANVVWHGTATAHIRLAIEPYIDVVDLARAWRIISPGSFVTRICARDVPILFILGELDRVVPFAQGIDFAKRLALPSKKVSIKTLPCGHYTVRLFPFNVIAFTETVRLIRRQSVR